MDADCKSKRQVNLEQLTALLDFLKEHQELAKGLTRGRRGKFHTLKIWNLCAKKMNAVKDGAVKDGKGWSKYWCDWKYRVRRRALELKAAKMSNRPPPEGAVPLSPMEETILSIIGEKAIDGVVIKMNPLGDEDSDQGEQDNNDNNEDVSNQFYGEQSQSQSSRHKRRRSKDSLSDVDDRSGPSSPREKKPRTTNRNKQSYDSDRDDEASEFLKVEKEKLETTRRIADSLEAIRSRIATLGDAMVHIRDILQNSRINL